MTELAKTTGTDKWQHSYIPFYHQLFNEKRQEIKRVLEIGIGDWSGRRTSLLLWRDFFPNAYIFGVDNEEKNMINGEKRITTLLRDQSSEVSLKDIWRVIAGGFDLIIDDGSHNPDHQLLSAQILMPLLKEDGVYIIEDVNDPTSIIEGLPMYTCRMVDFRGPGDRVITIKK